MTSTDHGLPVFYTPGQHLLIAAPGCVLMLGIDAEKAWDCWPLVRDGADADDLLDAILQVGLRSIGSFGLLRRSARGLRVVVRGSVVVDLGDRAIFASDEQSWVDVTLDADTPVTMGTQPVEDGLPLVLGVVRAASVSIGESRVTEPAAEVSPPVELQPPAEPEPEPELVDDAEESLGDVTIEPLDEDSPDRTINRSMTLEPSARLGETSSWPNEGDQPPRPTLIESMPFALNVAGTVDPPPEAPALHSVESEVDDATIVRGSIVHDVQAGDPTNLLVLAVRCAGGHLSPGFMSSCRVCGSTLDAQTPIEVMRPILGQLRLSTGDVVALDRGVVLGRAPSAPEGAAQVPHLIKLRSSDTDLSRSHVEVTLDGWHVVVTDLGSVNGTVATRPGSAPERLRAHESQIIEPGTVVNLAEVISFRFEATP